MIFTFFSMVIHSSAPDAKHIQQIVSQNVELQRQMLSQPVVSGIPLQIGKMAVTIAFKKTNDGYLHACSIFEYIREKEVNYKTIYLRKVDNSFGLPWWLSWWENPSTICLGSHSDDGIFSTIIGAFYFDDVQKIIKKHLPVYKKFISFITDDIFDEVWMQAELDSRCVNFSLRTDYWGEGPNGCYNCCSYAHKILNYCGVQLPFGTTTDKGRFNIKNDIGFIKALRDFANNGDPSNSIRLHAEGLQLLEEIQH